MKIKQRLNNNVVLVTDENNENVSMIVMGKGIGFKAYPGNKIDESLIESTFVLKKNDENNISKVSSLINELPMEYISVTDSILKEAEIMLDKEYGLPMLISLADHIYSAVSRQQEYVSALQWNIKQLYPNELKMGKRAILIVKEKLDITLNDSEATAIAMHFISQGYNYNSMQETMKFTKIISDIISIIQYHFQIKIDQGSINFSRLVTHLQYFLIRQVDNVEPLTVNESIIQTIINQYPESFQCAEKIVGYLNETQEIVPSLEEESYLTLHIERVRQVHLT